MNFDSIREFNNYMAKIKPTWTPEKRLKLAKFYNQIAELIAEDRDIALIAIIEITDDSLFDGEERGIDET